MLLSGKMKVRHLVPRENRFICQKVFDVIIYKFGTLNPIVGINYKIINLCNFSSVASVVIKNVDKNFKFLVQGNSVSGI